MAAAAVPEMPTASKARGGNMLALWQRRPGAAGRPGLALAGCGSRFTGGSRLRTAGPDDVTGTTADQAAALVAGHGRIVAEFFDTGHSRTLAWARRPQAAVLVAAPADPDQGWDAIVIGEHERALCGAQYASMAPLFKHYGIQLWTPELGAQIDYDAEDHEQVMVALALSSKREIARTGSGSGPRWKPRPASRAATWAAARPTGTGSPTAGRTRTRPCFLGAAGAPARAGPSDRAGRPLDVRSAAGRTQRRADHTRPE